MQSEQINILVIGRAKTGTTIIARTIHGALPGHEFLMEPHGLSPFLAEDRTPVVAKVIFEHWQQTPHLRMALLNNELPVKFSKTVAIVRDPRDEMISRMFYYLYNTIQTRPVDLEKLNVWLAMVKQKEANPGSVSMLNLLSGLGDAVKATINFGYIAPTFQYFSFLKRRSSLAHVIRYEDFIDQNLNALQKYLGFELVHSPSATPALARTNRTAKYGNWKHFFLQSDIKQFRTLYGDKMRNAGYTDWTLEPVEAIDPEHGSRYLERILKEATMRLEARRVANQKSMAETEVIPASN